MATRQVISPLATVAAFGLRTTPRRTFAGCSGSARRANVIRLLGLASFHGDLLRASQRLGPGSRNNPTRENRRRVGHGRPGCCHRKKTKSRLAFAHGNGLRLSALCAALHFSSFCDLEVGRLRRHQRFCKSGAGHSGDSGHLQFAGQAQASALRPNRFGCGHGIARRHGLCQQLSRARSAHAWKVSSEASSETPTTLLLSLAMTFPFVFAFAIRSHNIGVEDCLGRGHALNRVDHHVHALSRRFVGAGGSRRSFALGIRSQGKAARMAVPRRR